MKDMKQEDKELLLKDISARLPYGLILSGIAGHDVKITTNNTWVYFGACDEAKEHIKPYLRSMSSMTEEEKNEYFGRTMTIDIVQASKEVIDWLNAHHFDYHNLIEKGLALEAPEGMYNNQK